LTGIAGPAQSSLRYRRFMPEVQNKWLKVQDDSASRAANLKEDCGVRG
jgi:hypothetical protein